MLTSCEQPWLNPQDVFNWVHTVAVVYTGRAPASRYRGGGGVFDTTAAARRWRSKNKKTGILGNPGEFLEAEECLGRQLGAHLKHG